MSKSVAAYISGVARALGTFTRRLWRSLAGRGTLLFGLFFSLLLALLFFLGTEQGRVLLTRGAVFGAQKFIPHIQIHAGRIESDQLGAWYLSELNVSYRDQSLLYARELTLAVDPGDLIQKRIHVERLGAADILFNNDTLKAILAEQDQDSEVPASQRQLELPAMRLGVLDLDRLQVIDQARPSLPPVSVRGSGSYRWQQLPARLQLDVRELDGAGLRIAIKGEETQPRHYTGKFSAREDAGGFVGSLLQLPQGQELDAQGRIALWQPGDNQLLFHIEKFSLPLVEHQFALSGRAALTLVPWKVASEGLLLSVDGSSHKISGSISAQQVDAEIHFNRLPVTVSQLWQDYLQGGWLSADLTVQGPLKLPAVTGTIELNSSYSSQPLILHGRLQTQQQVITLESLSLQLADAHLEARGDVDIEAESIDLSGEIQRLEVDSIRELLAALPATATVKIPSELQGVVKQLQLSASGPWKNPELRAELDAHTLFRKLDADLHALAEGDVRKIILSEIQLDGETLSLGGSGEIDIVGKGLQLQLALSAENFRPGSQLELVAAEDTVLDLDAEVGISGPWQNPLITAHLQSDGSYRDYRFSLRGDAAGNLEKIMLDGLRLDLFADGDMRHFGAEPLRGPQSLVERPKVESDGPQPLQNHSRIAALAEEAEQLGRAGNAWLEIDGEIEPKAARVQGSVSARNIPVSLLKLTGMKLPLSLEGEINVEGEFSGPFARPEASVNLLARGAYRSEPWQLQGEIAYGSGRIELSDVELWWAERNQLSAQGSLNKQQLDLEVRGHALLADFESWLATDLSERGEVTLWATAAGSPQQPQLAGEFRLTGQAPAPAAETVQVQPLSLVLDWRTQGEDLRMALNAQHGSRQAIEAEGRLAVAPILEQLFADAPPSGGKPPLPLELSARGRADLSAVAVFVDPEIHAMRGQLQFKLDADGSVAEPNLEGYVSLENGAYEHRPSNTRLRRIDFAARMTPSEWRIERGRAEDGEKGSIHLSGGVGFPHKAPPQLDLQLRADRAHLLNTPAVRGAISGGLTLSGDIERARLEGRLTVRPLVVQVEQLFGTSVPEIEVVEVELDGPQVERARPLLLQNIALAVQVVVDQQSYIRGLGLDSELRGQVNIAGTAAKPQAGGELRIVRGSFDLLGKRFKLQEGQVQFENNVGAIYVKGLHEYSEGEITAEISGTLTGAQNDLEVTFSSTPAAAQDEIFAQLLFGKSLTDISPLQAVRLVTVVSSLQSGRMMFDPVAKTRELLRVDILDIEQETTDEGEQYALSLGKYITNRIFIELQRSTDPLNPWQAEMQIELKRNLNLEIKSADDTESGAGSVELQWKKDY